ncbi:MAG: nuclear transport factor 2 family protein [Alphaproteobacteria bacterium]|nr:nuclear transport factor 2 family protein [Alphaproteobacteria bacterium]
MLAGYFIAGPAAADMNADKDAITAVALHYIESQHTPDKNRMGKALHPDMKKRTYWHKKDGSEYVMETSRDTMLWVAENYNKDGKAFPEHPRKDINILALDGRIASVKLTADDWIDYMHLMKSDDGTWQIINVLWQFHDHAQHVDR